mgnify:CR=1 FL=1
MAALFSQTTAYSATFTVTNLNDAGAGSFRQAIIDANGSAGTDNIHFSVSGGINLISSLPALTDVVVIDGSTAPGWSTCGNPVVGIDGSSTGTSNGIQLLAGASGSSILALNIRDFTANGIQLISATNCIIQGCYIGTNSVGTAAASNGQNGIILESGANNNLIGGSLLCQGNLISGNLGYGITIVGSTSTQIRGNIIGLNVTESASIANSIGGILVTSASNGTIIGGSTSFQANNISGNGSGVTGNGLNIDGSSGVIIQGNLIGLDGTGNIGIGNAENGISLNGASSAIIGGSGANEMNVIADHNFHAIVLNNSSNNVTIQGNNIGTNALGTVAIGNDDSGVIVINSTGTIIGGSSANEGNVLSGSLSEYGIFAISSSGLEIEGNFVGTDRTGTIDLANFDGGIRFDFGAGGSSIGGSGAGDGNTIAYNTGYGVGVLNAGSSGVLISRNSIYCNTGKGIDLAGVGNTNEPSPVINTIGNTGASGTANNNTTIELFYDTICGGSCQGKTYIASVSTSGPGNWSYVGPLTGNITATATDLGDNTSEFANCLVFLPVEFGAFEGFEMDNGQHLLGWSTITERDASHFTIERSTDGHNWTLVGSITAIGNSTSENIYQLIDPKPEYGMNYYRLLQFDVDGSMDQHETIVRLDRTRSNGSELVGVYNLLGQLIDPATKGVQVHVFSDGTTKKVIVD